MRQVLKETIRRRQKRNKRKKAQEKSIDRPKPVRLAAPEIFSIEANPARGEVIEFLTTLRELTLRKDVHLILIDFSSTRQFISTATLLFYAELCRLLEMVGGRIQIKCKPPTNEKACQVLHQIGVYQKCGQKIARRPAVFEDVVHWRVAHGHVVDNTICAPAIEEFEGQLAYPLVDGIFRGLGEAMTNAIHHAYLGIRDDNLQYQQPKKDWWMFSQAKDGMLSVVFCDLGIGIPNTLPIQKPNLFERIIALGHANSDCACIADAIEDSRTRTNQPERGKGLGNIIDVVSGFNGGLVRIYSNHGMFASANTSKASAKDFSDSILGTLIYWRVPLGEKYHGK